MEKIGMLPDYASVPHNFLGLPAEYSTYRDAKFVVLPVAYEHTTTFRKGTCNGPAAIIAASREVELFDEETGTEPYLSGVATLDEPAVAVTPELMVEHIYDVGKRLVSDGKCVIMLGGEHSISVGLVKAYAERCPKLSVLQLDAHADLRDEYQHSRYSHACAMRRIRERVGRTVSLGIRNLSKEEHDWVGSERIPLIYAGQMLERSNWQQEALAGLTDEVYVTIDCDYFDPALMPAVGTPEPGGGQWYPTLAFLKDLAERKRIVGFDVVELAPIPGTVVSEFTAARLIYKLIGYICARG